MKSGLTGKKDMTARECISPLPFPHNISEAASVSANMPALDVLHPLLEAPGRRLGVVDTDGTLLGMIDAHSMLEALGRIIAQRDDSSLITIICAAGDYSASHIAHAVEDADAHLVDLISSPAADGRIRVFLRVRHTDPTAAVRSLERYGFFVEEAIGANSRSADLALERMAALISYLNV